MRLLQGLSCHFVSSLHVLLDEPNKMNFLALMLINALYNNPHLENVVCLNKTIDYRRIKAC